MADGTYERRGPREAELKRFRRILAEQAKKREEAESVRAFQPTTGSNHKG